MAKVHAQRSPIFVLQMGRVGSTSVVSAISQAYQEIDCPVAVHHNHYIANYQKVQERARQDLEDYSLALGDIERVDRGVRETLLAQVEKNHPVKIISLVRDPVARNVSTFFFAFSQFVPDWKEKETQGLLSASALNVIFEGKRHFIQTAFHWFDEQIKDGLGLDVYAVPFDAARGWQVYKQGPVELLVLRMEDLYRTGEAILRQFLHLPAFKMVKVNTGEERESYELYRRFLTHPISQEYLEMTYATKLARHFYTEAEIAQSIHRWRNPKG
ncbi:MAG: hypothetical protein HXY38_09400 [Chloroflexi bacterium]|nr:hypothetical protein [Chloroflexota bacterium]